MLTPAFALATLMSLHLIADPVIPTAPPGAPPAPSAASGAPSAAPAVPSAAPGAPAAPLPPPDPAILQAMPPPDLKLIEQDIRALQRTTFAVALRFGNDLGGMARCGADTTDLARLASALDATMATWAPNYGADKVVAVVQDGMKAAVRVRHADGATFCKHMRERYLRYRAFLQNGDALLLRPE